MKIEITKKVDKNEVMPYLSEEYKSNEQEYNRAIENAKQLINDYSSTFHT